jgi:hypothetical protein
VEPDTTNREEEAAAAATTRKKDSPTICSTFHQRYFLNFHCLYSYLSELCIE